MAMLSIEDQQRFRLVHGKQFLYSCDGPCGLLIPATEMPIVRTWGPRKDKLLFLGAIPKDVLCKRCADVASGKVKIVDGLVKDTPEPTDKPKPKRRDMIAAVRRNVIRILTDEKPKTGYSTDELILKLYRKASLREHKKGEIRKTLGLMKRFRDLKKANEKWKLA